VEGVGEKKERGAGRFAVGEKEPAAGGVLGVSKKGKREGLLEKGGTCDEKRRRGGFEKGRLASQKNKWDGKKNWGQQGRMFLENHQPGGTRSPRGEKSRLSHLGGGRQSIQLRAKNVFKNEKGASGKGGNSLERAQGKRRGFPGKRKRGNDARCDNSRRQGKKSCGLRSQKRKVRMKGEKKSPVGEEVCAVAALKTLPRTALQTENIFLGKGGGFGRKKKIWEKKKSPDGPRRTSAGLGCAMAERFWGFRFVWGGGSS